jgi:hypothetical protein
MLNPSRIGYRRSGRRVLVGRLESDHLEDLDVDGRILWWILNRLGGVDWITVV